MERTRRIEQAGQMVRTSQQSIESLATILRGMQVDELTESQLRTMFVALRESIGTLADAGRELLLAIDDMAATSRAVDSMAVRN